MPPHRFTPLKEQWLKIYTPLVEQLKLQVRMNLKSRRVEIRVRLQRMRPRRRVCDAGPLKARALRRVDGRAPLQTSEFTEDTGSLQKAADFVRAFMMGFDVDVRARS